MRSVTWDTQVGGGGLDLARLTTGTLYRGINSVTTVQNAREVFLSMAPECFSISLSACYNYIENYSQGSTQAKLHHAGNEVNASTS